MNGYSDRINHALAFAAKHHDIQVRKGTRNPYVTQPANIAVILTSYRQDVDTVVAGVLHDVIDDCVRGGWTREMLSDRISDKFGEGVLDTVISVIPRKLDDDGNELDKEERRTDFLARLAQTSEQARWVCAADQVHNGSVILADLHRTVDADSVWSRFAVGRDGTIRAYRSVYERLLEVGFTAAILDELRGVVVSLEQFQNPPVAAR